MYVRAFVCMHVHAVVIAARPTQPPPPPSQHTHNPTQAMSHRLLTLTGEAAASLAEGAATGLLDLPPGATQILGLAGDGYVMRRRTQRRYRRHI